MAPRCLFPGKAARAALIRTRIDLRALFVQRNPVFVQLHRRGCRSGVLRGKRRPFRQFETRGYVPRVVTYKVSFTAGSPNTAPGKRTWHTFSTQGKWLPVVIWLHWTERRIRLHIVGYRCQFVYSNGERTCLVSAHQDGATMNQCGEGGGGG